MNIKTKLNFAFIMALLWLLAKNANAQSSTPDNLLWSTSGAVASVVSDGTTTFIGGSFAFVGPNTGCLASVSTTTGSLNNLLPYINGKVLVTISDGNGGYYVGGTFTKVGTVSVTNLAHIKSDLTVDNNFKPNPSSFVSALALVGSTLYVGGNFSNLGGQARSFIAALNTSDGTATS